METLRPDHRQISKSRGRLPPARWHERQAMAWVHAKGAGAARIRGQGIGSTVNAPPPTLAYLCISQVRVQQTTRFSRGSEPRNWSWTTVNLSFGQRLDKDGWPRVHRLALGEPNHGLPAKGHLSLILILRTQAKSWLRGAKSLTFEGLPTIGTSACLHPVIASSGSPCQAPLLCQPQGKPLETHERLARILLS